MNPLLRAEQAVLGAVLLDPDQLGRLGWLAPEHFSRPVHRALFTTMRTLHTNAHPAVSTKAKAVVPLSWVTDTVAEASRHVRGLTAPYAHALIAACPRSGNAPLYGRMVLEGAIHRTVTEHAVRLHQAARADALRGDVEGALHQADVLAGVLGDLARRWGTEPRPQAPTTPPATAAAEPALAGTDDAVEDERFLLAVLTERSGAMDEVVGWLRPVDFADPAHAHLYQCLGALHHRGEPIDRMTLLWEAQRRGLLADGTLTAEQLAGICDGVGAGSAEWLGEQVIRSSLTRTAAATARTVRALAEDETLAPGRLISHALYALGPLDEVRARWQSACDVPGPTPAPAPTATDTSPPVRVHAALARSTPQPPSRPSQRPGAPPTPPAGRPSSRTPV
ncbi:DnaB-like helicase N-terminal domain-containing protein [Streptomyces sp. NPDC002018]|uniref:DnaB-like helicase N-terminal domain-containing protein n=1 Tax=Streptomyces sp. NPDC002018 TaxID=3364629 RepID=UPI0036CCE421